MPLNLSIRMSFAGSIDERLDAAPDGLREDRRRSEALRPAENDIVGWRGDDEGGDERTVEEFKEFVGNQTGGARERNGVGPMLP